MRVSKNVEIDEKKRSLGREASLSKYMAGASLEAPLSRHLNFKSMRIFLGHFPAFPNEKPLISAGRSSGF